MLLGKPTGNRFHNIHSNEELETVTDGESSREYNFYLNVRKPFNYYYITSSGTDNVHIDWLSINLDPSIEVFERWVSSYDKRRKILTHPKTSIFDYMNRFPCLKSQEAKELVLIIYVNQKLSN